MSMHLEGPWLSTTGKRKAKKKWASAEQKRQHEELAENWKKVVASHAPKKPIPVKKPATLASSYKLAVPAWRTTENIPSKSSGVGTAVKRESMTYTGDKIKGIGTMHKSNAVPVFSEQEALEISQMRRN